MSCNTSRWGPSAFCGYGNCTSSTITEPSGSGQVSSAVCSCQQDWRFDRTFFKTNACWQPRYAMNTVQMTVGILSLIVGIYGLISLRSLTNDAKHFAVLTILAMILNAGYMISHHFEGDTHGYASVTLCILVVLMLSNAYAIALHALLRILWVVAKEAPTSLTRMFLIVQGGEFVAYIGCGITMIVFISLNDDQGFSTAMAVSELIFDAGALINLN